MTGIVLDPSGKAWSPARIETPAGKREYADAQRVFAGRGIPIRSKLIEWSERLLSLA